MPNRIIKESIGTSETLAQLSGDEERHFWRIVVQADDYGRFDARPHAIRAKAYAAMLPKVSETESEARTASLVKAGLVRLYLADERPYGYIVTWDRHQRTRAKVSKYPQPPTYDSTRQQPTSYVAVFGIENRESYSYSEAVSESESESTREPPPPPPPLDSRVAQFFKAYESEIGQITPMVREEILDILDTLNPSEEWITDAVKESAAHNKRNLAYIRAVLLSWKTDGRGRPAKGQRNGTANDPEQLPGGLPGKGPRVPRISRFTGEVLPDDELLPPMPRPRRDWAP